MPFTSINIYTLYALKQIRSKCRHAEQRQIHLAFHNHPSGKAEPSREDIHLTRRLQEAGKIMCIELLDHVIIGERNYVSLKEKEFI